MDVEDDLPDDLMGVQEQQMKQPGNSDEGVMSNMVHGQVNYAKEAEVLGIGPLDDLLLLVR